MERSESSLRRAQTTLDFTIGITIFLVVLAAVFLFVPGTLQPFSEGGQENIVSVNRVADDLSEGSLATEGTSHILNGTCTEAFFNSTNRCGFDSTDVADLVGLGEFKNANVTIIGNVSTRSGVQEILCYDHGDAPGSRLASPDPDCGSSETRLAIGDDPSVAESSVTARRVVELDGRDIFLVVKVW